MIISVKRLHPQAILPSYAHHGDGGLDLFSVEECSLAPQERKAVRTGIALEIPAGAVGLVWDKSGRAVNEGLKTMAGVIDAGYRGEVKVVLMNLGNAPIPIAPGEKIAQLLIQPVVSAEIREVETLSSTSRQEGGFGSTGNTL